MPDLLAYEVRDLVAVRKQGTPGDRQPYKVELEMVPHYTARRVKVSTT
jgi:hypothetical protein